MCINDLRLFAKNENVSETLIQTIRMYNEDIRMGFGIDKYAMLVMKRGKRQN